MRISARSTAAPTNIRDTAAKRAESRESRSVPSAHTAGERVGRRARTFNGIINMSDDNSPVVEEQKKKRGRPAKADKNAVKEGPKKRGRPAAEKNNAVRPSKSDNEDEAPPGPVKKGRGRPKGSHKKKQGPPKGTTTSPRGRGRPKKTEEKPEITGEDEDEQEEEEEEEEN
ncbi:hypothetical protein DMN91_001727 [Ooceraea biroi]|uniref:High mobility group protein I n=2 Tax=Ooceraea biroi TaxID=2015173 RepID=A0A3L8DYM4_OOCBI|nr:ABC transporter F family member 4 isoform X1 [Ooceraea biroi]RLU25570.1 hypothetical protein DMN91_001727 [Ooceraea biroi]